MKSLNLKLLKLVTVAWVVIAGSTATTMAQDPRIQIGQLDALAAKASQTVDVNIDERLLRLTARFLSSKDADEAKVKDLVSGLKGIYVKVFQFETENQYADSDLEGIRSQLRHTAWNKIVNVRSRKEGNVEVYLMQVGNQISGLALLAAGPKEIAVVNIIGPVDLDKLTQLEGEFGIPELKIERSQPKRKN